MDYRVVPDALRENVKFLNEVADAWDGARRRLNGQDLGPDDLGLLGRGVPDSHNSALHDCLGKLTEGLQAIEAAGQALRNVADNYESRDATYYLAFGYLNEQLH